VAKYAGGVFFLSVEIQFYCPLIDVALNHLFQGPGLNIGGMILFLADGISSKAETKEGESCGSSA
jgi:hypothetical protein